MRPEHLNILACPLCRSSLQLFPARVEGEHVMEGTLRCTGCARTYPVHAGIPRLFLSPAERILLEVAERFGQQWKTFAELNLDVYRKQLTDWLAPYPLKAFRKKYVLDAGCGKGRHLRIVAEYQPSLVVGLDISDAVHVAFQHTRHLPCCLVVQGDLLHPPFARESFDVVYSVGVIHHLPSPREGFRRLQELVRKGGDLLVWVYAREGNQFYITLVEPIRRLTTRLPHSFLFGLSFILAGNLKLCLRLGVHRLIPYPYLRYVSDFPVRELASIIYDQLSPPITHYIPQKDLREWSKLWIIQSLRFHNANSWALWVRRPPAGKKGDTLPKNHELSPDSGTEDGFSDSGEGASDSPENSENV